MKDEEKIRQQYIASIEHLEKTISTAKEIITDENMSIITQAKRCPKQLINDIKIYISEIELSRDDIKNHRLIIGKDSKKLGPQLLDMFNKTYNAAEKINSMREYISEATKDMLKHVHESIGIRLLIEQMEAAARVMNTAAEQLESYSLLCIRESCSLGHEEAIDRSIDLACDNEQFTIAKEFVETGFNHSTPGFSADFSAILCFSIELKKMKHNWNNLDNTERYDSILALAKLINKFSGASKYRPYVTKHLESFNDFFICETKGKHQSHLKKFINELDDHLIPTYTEALASQFRHYDCYTAAKGLDSESIYATMTLAIIKLKQSSSPSSMELFDAFINSHEPIISKLFEYAEDIANKQSLAHKSINMRQFILQFNTLHGIDYTQLQICKDIYAIAYEIEISDCVLTHKHHDLRSRLDQLLDFLSSPLGVIGLKLDAEKIMDSLCKHIQTKYHNLSIEARKGAKAILKRRSHAQDKHGANKDMYIGLNEPLNTYIKRHKLLNMIMKSILPVETQHGNPQSANGAKSISPEEKRLDRIYKLTYLCYKVPLDPKTAIDLSRRLEPNTYPSNIIHEILGYQIESISIYDILEMLQLSLKDDHDYNYAMVRIFDSMFKGIHMCVSHLCTPSITEERKSFLASLLPSKKDIMLARFNQAAQYINEQLAHNSSPQGEDKQKPTSPHSKHSAASSIQDIASGQRYPDARAAGFFPENRDPKKSLRDKAIENHYQLKLRLQHPGR